MANYEQVARNAARKYGLNEDVFVRQIRQESGFNPHAKSPAGATGIAQIMPATAAGWGVNPNDPRASLNAAAKHMAAYVKQYGSYKNALVAYNAGPGRVGKSLPTETQNYIRIILGGKEPSASGVKPGGSGNSAGGSSDSGGSSTVTTTTPGQDFTHERARAFVNYLENGGQGGILGLHDTLQGMKDIPATTTTKTVSSGGGSSDSTKSSGGSSGGTSLEGIKDKSPLFELIHKGDEAYAIKDGKKVPASFYSAVWDGHANHVHVAAGPQTIVALGKLAQDMGLHVGENPHFGGVAPVHSQHSYHYRNEAIDVSGDPHKMNAFARRVEQIYGLR